MANLCVLKPRAVVLLSIVLGAFPGNGIYHSDNDLQVRITNIMRREQGQDGDAEGTSSWASSMNAAVTPSVSFRGLLEKSGSFVSHVASTATRLPLLPYPMSVVEHGGKPFSLRRKSIITVGGPEREEVVRALLEFIHDAPSGTTDDEYDDCGHATPTIHLQLNTAAFAMGLNPESYNLTVGACRVELVAPSLAGLFYGVQTMKQLSAGGINPIPSVTIRDEPRLKWRGLHLDVSRHFFSADKIKSLIGTISYFKFNRFHWHLTDDQGWRMPVFSLPKLVEIGSRNKYGEKEYYTADQIADIVKYASARHVEIVPEVDIPGHSTAAIAAYPALGNIDSFQWKAPSGPVSSYGMKQFTLSPNDATLRFIDEVFGQVASYFPGAFVHIGGDEAPTNQWESSSAAQKKAKAENVSQVQALFNEKVSQTLRKLNKTVVAWDEAQDITGLSDDAVIMAWRSEDELVKAVQAGRYAINSGVSNYYFNEAETPCDLPLQQVYDYDPVPSYLRSDEKDRILGAQGQLWSEHFTSWKVVEYFAFPRSLALAERTWTPNAQIDGYEEFLTRLRIRLDDLDGIGVLYRTLDDS